MWSLNLTLKLELNPRLTLMIPWTVKICLEWPSSNLYVLWLKTWPFYTTSYWGILHNEQFNTKLDLVLSNNFEQCMYKVRQCIKKLRNIIENYLIFFYSKTFGIFVLLIKYVDAIIHDKHPRTLVCHTVSYCEVEGPVV